MSRVGLDWYKREPVAYLGDVQGLSSKEHAVYSVVLDLLYIHGGEIRNDPKWIAGWISDMGSAAVRKSLASLDQNDRITITITDTCISQKRAKNEAKTKEKLRETASKSGKIGGKKSAEIRVAAKENNDLDQADPSTEIQAEKRREDIKRDTKVSPKKSRQTGSRLSEDWQLPQQWGEWALSEGWGVEAIRLEADKFRDYWIAKSGKDATKTNWLATWRNWMRNSKTPKLKQIEGGAGYASDKTDRLRRVVTAGARGTSSKDWG